MTLVVQKFGGTSVGTPERIQAVADRIIYHKQRGEQVVVVVSAMSGETNRLVGLIDAIGSHGSPREQDVILATGEQVTIGLLALALSNKGQAAQSFTGGQVKILTNSVHMKARIDHIETQPILDALAQDKVAIVAGFQGMDECGSITTLGRGGSDTTAVALAVALKADECQIYTDVDGVYTTDPRVEPSARHIPCLGLEEMLEMASQGSKVLQIRSVEFAYKYGMPIRVLSSFDEPGQGKSTLVTRERFIMEKAIVRGVAFSRDAVQLTVMAVPDEPGIAHKILGPIAEANIDVDMIIQNTSSEGTTDFTFTAQRDDLVQCQAILEQLSIGSRIKHKTGIAKVSIVGVGMRSHAGVAYAMFKALADEGINIFSITTSEIKVTVVIDEKYLELAVRILHKAFQLDEETNENGDEAPK